MISLFLYSLLTWSSQHQIPSILRFYLFFSSLESVLGNVDPVLGTEVHLECQRRAQLSTIEM